MNLFYHSNLGEKNPSEDALASVNSKNISRRLAWSNSLKGRFSWGWEDVGPKIFGTNSDDHNFKRWWSYSKFLTN